MRALWKLTTRHVALTIALLVIALLNVGIELSMAPSAGDAILLFVGLCAGEWVLAMFLLVCGAAGM